MTAIVLDTETTDVDDDAEIIEFAMSQTLDLPADIYGHVEITGSRFGSTRPIALGAMAVHHIIDSDIEGLDRFAGFDLVVPREVRYVIGHNIDFDWRMLGRPTVRRICTMALARAMFPGLDSHTLAAIVYHLAVTPAVARMALKAAHSAEGDVRLLTKIVLPYFVRVLGVETWEALWIISEDARIPTVMSFGKHKGLNIADIPYDYKRWLLGQPDVDPYLAIALRK